MNALIQVEPDQYQARSYDSQARFTSYWHQIDELRGLQAEIILEVGIGNGFVSDYLRKRGMRVTTVDIDGRLVPDAVGTVHALPFADNAFEVAACFEVFEHLPYEAIASGLAEVARVAHHYIVLSVPDGSDAGWVNVRLGAFGRTRYFRRLFTLPRLQPRVQPRTLDEHYWEIGIKGYPLSRVITDLQLHTGFLLIKHYRSFLNPYHRFFVLRRTTS